MQAYLELLGKKARDRITRMEGIVSSVCFDLYGCVQVALTPGMNEKDGKLADGHWFDWKRLDVLDHNRAMPIPAYEKGPGVEVGAAEKPAR